MLNVVKHGVFFSYLNKYDEKYIMIADLTYYKLLEISPEANEQEIRTSYKKLCIKYHPDKNTGKTVETKTESTEQYKKIQQAYKILSDPNKRFMYDRYGIDEKTGRLNGEKFNEMYDAGYLSGKKRKKRKPKNNNSNFKIKDVRANIIMSLEQCYEGCSTQVTYTRFDIKKKNSTIEDVMCNICNGIGYHEILDNNDYIFKKFKKKCIACNGTCIDKEYIIQRGVTKIVKIPAGIYEGRTVILKGEGNEIPNTNGKRTDLRGIIKELRKQQIIQTSESTYHYKGHLDFYRGIGEKIYNLRVIFEITYLQLVCGTYIAFNHLNKEIVYVNIPPNTISRVLRVPGLGLPVWDGKEGERGDLIIRLEIIQSNINLSLNDKKRKEIWKIATGKILVIQPKKEILPTAEDFNELDDDDEKSFLLRTRLNYQHYQHYDDSDVEPPDYKLM